MTPRRSFNASAGAFTPVASGGRAGAGRGGAGVIGFGCGLCDGCGAWGACAACGSVACGSAARDARDADGDSTSPVSNEATSDTGPSVRSEEHTSELQSLTNLVCRLLLEKKKK